MFRSTRIRTVALFTAAFVVVGIVQPALASNGFHFAVLSDRTGGHVEGVYPRVIEEIARLNPDFVVTVGDQIEGYTDDMVRANAEWDTIVAFLDGLDCPVYLTAGNHDIWSDDSEKIYRDRTGYSPYYSFDHGNAHFVVLDNSRLESWSDVGPEQLQWLRADLDAASDAEHVFVFAHKPLWTQTLALGLNDPLHDILAAHAVDVHFTGHVHLYFSAEYDGVNYISMGSSGGAMMSSEHSTTRGEFFQFGWVTVEDDYEVAVVELGAVHGPDVSTVAVQEEIRRAESEYVRAEPLVLSDGDSVDDDITVIVENHSSMPINDAISWAVPEGWTVDPLSVPLMVEPGATAEFVFRGTTRGRLFPAPSFSVSYPLSDGREVRASGRPRIIRVAEAVRLRSRPTMDGQVSESCWKGATVEREFFSDEGPPGVEGASEFRFAYDKSDLYVSVVCHDPGIEDLAAAVEERDGAVYGEDCVGFFIQPDLDETTVYQIYVNPSGVIFDQQITFDETMWYTTHVDWNGDIETVTDVRGEAWGVEIRVPFAELGLDGPPDAVGLNFRRKQPAGWPPADWQVPIDYDPNTFGRLRFERS